MNVCISELIKTTKKIEERIDQLKRLRNECVTYSYLKDEKPIIPETNLLDITKQIHKLQDKVIYLRNKIAYLNATIQVPEFGISLGGCIIKLGQLKAEAEIFKGFSERQSITRQTIGFKGEVEYTQINYNIEEAKAIYKEMNDTISKLQMAIDRCNLNTMVDIPDRYLIY